MADSIEKEILVELPMAFKKGRIADIKMVMAIESSTQVAGNVKYPVLHATSVIQCPRVNADTNTITDFQEFNVYRIQRHHKNNI